MVDAHVYVYYTSGCTLLLGGESWCVVSYHCGSLRCSLKVQGNAKASELGMSNSQTPTLFFVPIYLCYLQKTIASGRSAIGDKYMKKILLLAVLPMLALNSCKTISKAMSESGGDSENGTVSSTESLIGNGESYVSTAKTAQLHANLLTTTTVADLNVNPTKITYTCDVNMPNTTEGKKSAMNFATAKALMIHNGDVMVEPLHQLFVDNDKIKKVTVAGYVATYTNYRTANRDEIKLAKDGKAEETVKVVKEVKPTATAEEDSKSKKSKDKKSKEDKDE